MVTAEQGHMHKSQDCAGEMAGATALTTLSFSFQALLALCVEARLGPDLRLCFLILLRLFRTLALLLPKCFGDVLAACDRQVGKPVSFTSGRCKSSLIFIQRVPFLALSNSNHKRRFPLARPAKEPDEGLPLQGYQPPQRRLQLELEISRSLSLIL
jgi:hypothetical protein